MFEGVPDPPDGFFVSLIHLHVVHVRLPVLDVAGVIRGEEPLVIMRPLHAADLSIMGLFKLSLIKKRCAYLENGLKVECESVPQRKFPTTGTGYQSTALGGPLAKQGELGIRRLPTQTQ